MHARYITLKRDVFRVTSKVWERSDNTDREIVAIKHSEH